MTYTVNPADAGTPTDLQGARQGAEEFRLLKARVNTVAAAAGIGGLSAIPFKNKIINGDFIVDQRNAYAAVNVPITGFSTYGPDRFYSAGAPSGLAAYTIKSDADAVYNLGERRLLVEVTTAEVVTPVDAFYFIGHTIEGYSVRDLHYGSDYARSCVISFEVESTIPGVFGLVLHNDAYNRNYVTTFSVNQANTRETKTLVIPGDLIGTWPKDNNPGLYVWVILASGSNYFGVPNNWTAANIRTISSQTNFMATVGNKIWFRNFQVEAGTEATSFEYLPFDVQKIRCMRYFESSFPNGVAPAYNTNLLGGEFSAQAMAAGAVLNRLPLCSFKVEKRKLPTIVIYNPNAFASNEFQDEQAGDCTGTVLVRASTKGFVLNTTTPAGTNLGNRLSANWTADAEL